MKKISVLIITILSVGAGCTSSAKHSATHSTKALAPPTTLHFVAVPITGSSTPTNPAAAGTILMLKLYVGDLDKAQTFYHSVFGATPAMAMGATANIMTFPKGGPGLVLLHAAANDATKRGSFIIKVPNLQTTKALALSDGATEQGTFAGSPAGQAAKSVDLLDPWGNQVEILQLG